MMKITVFTPTYNRAYIIGNLYNSLCQQDYCDFEWLVIDDGSTDETEQLFSQWINTSFFPIRYIKQANAGKHIAVNRGVKEAKGQIFFIVDSDDQLPLGSLSIVSKYFSQILNDSTFAGVCGLKAHFDGRRVGGDVDFETLDCTHFERAYKYKIKGDMAEAFWTNVLKDYPFPDYPGEKYCAESLIWNRIACHYKMRYFAEKIYLCEYLSDGLSQSFVQNKRRSPRYATLICREIMIANVPLMVRIKNAISFWRYAPLCIRHSGIMGLPFIAWLFSPIGILLFLLDSIRYNK